MKAGTAAKVGIGVIGALCMGIIGFRIMVHHLDVEPTQVIESRDGHSQKTVPEIAPRPGKMTASDELKLSDTSDNADADVGDAPSKPQDEISAEDINAFLTFLDELDEEADEISKPSEAELKAEHFWEKAAETRAKMEDLLYRCIDVGEEMLTRTEEAARIKDDVEREAAFERLKELRLGYEQVRLIKEIGGLECDYAHYASEEWEEAMKPGGWLYELKIRVRPNKPITVGPAM